MLHSFMVPPAKREFEVMISSSDGIEVFWGAEKYDIGDDDLR